MQLMAVKPSARSGTTKDRDTTPYSPLGHAPILPSTAESGCICNRTLKSTCAGFFSIKKNYTPTTALAELQQVHKTDTTVQKLKIAWVENFYHRRVKLATPATTVQGLTQFLEDMPRKLPDDPDEVFVLHEAIEETGDNFLVVFSTVNLLRNAAQGNGEVFFHLDGTFQVTKEGFECLVLATGDMSHVVLPLALGVGTAERKKVVGPFLEVVKRWIGDVVFPDGEEWEPKYSMSDQSAVLRGEIAAIFPSLLVLGDCYFHVKQALRDRFSVLGDHYDMVRSDINALHRVPCPEAFKREKEKALERWEKAGVRQSFLNAWRKKCGVPPCRAAFIGQPLGGSVFRHQKNLDETHAASLSQVSRHSQDDALQLVQAENHSL